MPKPRAARPYRTRGGRCDGRPVAARGLWRERRDERSERRRTEPRKVKGTDDEERSEEEGKIKGLLVLEVKWLISQVLSV